MRRKSKRPPWLKVSGFVTRLLYRRLLRHLKSIRVNHFGFALIGLTTGLSIQGCATGRVAQDAVTESAVANNDSTAIIQGCGSQPSVGFAWCRKQEGDSTDDTLTFLAPPAKCNRPNCAFIKIFDNQGDLVYGEPFPKEGSRLDVKWMTILSQKKDKIVIQKNDGAPLTPPSQSVDVFNLSQRGFWSWNLEVYYIGEDGRERSSKAQGDIVLRVYKKNYVPLHAVSDDPNFSWEWTEKNLFSADWDVKYTSSLRAYVGIH